MTIASRRVLLPATGLAVLFALVGMAHTATDPIPAPRPERPGVYVRVGGRLTQLAELRHGKDLAWDVGPDFDGPVELLNASHELWPCTDEGLAIS